MRFPAASIKNDQLQLRVSAEEKALIKRRAKSHNLSVSEWVLRCTLGQTQGEFAKLLEQLVAARDATPVLAAIHDWLTLSSNEHLLGDLPGPPPALSAELQNQLAAMVEVAVQRAQGIAPAWTREVEPLEAPTFASSLQSVRLHLLLNAPVVFRRRNIFSDTSLGGRV